MSDIKSKIKELELLQLKVDYLKQVVEFPSKLKPANSDETKILPEVVELVSELLTPIIESLEAGEALATTNSTSFTEDEVSLLKKLALRASTPRPPKPSPASADVKVNSAWALENQHLGGARVKTSVLSEEVEGVVVSLKEPFVVIKLDTGNIHQATLDKIQII